MTRFFTTVALFLAFVIPAQSAARCVPNEVLLKTLTETFGEVPVLTAMQGSVPMVIFSNLDTGSFTVVSVGPESSCVVATGTDLEIIMQGDPA